MRCGLWFLPCAGFAHKTPNIRINTNKWILKIVIVCMFMCLLNHFQPSPQGSSVSFVVIIWFHGLANQSINKWCGVLVVDLNKSMWWLRAKTICILNLEKCLLDGCQNLFSYILLLNSLSLTVSYWQDSFVVWYLTFPTKSVLTLNKKKIYGLDSYMLHSFVDDISLFS